ncbi:adenosylcobinamide-GDP ribazoletransferase, partial [Mangrovicoccus algicola]
LQPAGPVLAVAAAAALVVAAGLARLARARLGGQTGDVLGAVQITTEIVLLALSAALLTGAG